MPCYLSQGWLLLKFHGNLWAGDTIYLFKSNCDLPSHGEDPALLSQLDDLWDDVLVLEHRKTPHWCTDVTLKSHRQFPIISTEKAYFSLVLFQHKLMTWCCQAINSLAPGRSGCDSKNGILNLVLLIGIFKFSYDNVLRWMPQNFTDDKSTFVQVMDWCRQATSHYLNQCWPRSPMPYGVTRPQWVHMASLGPNELTTVH